MQFPPVIADYIPVSSVATSPQQGNVNFGSLGQRTNSFGGVNIDSRGGGGIGIVGGGGVTVIPSVSNATSPPNNNNAMNIPRKTSKPALPSSNPITIGSPNTGGGAFGQPHSFGSNKQQFAMNAQQQHQMSISPPFSTGVVLQSPPNDRFQPPPVTPPFGVSPPKNVTNIGNRVFLKNDLEKILVLTIFFFIGTYFDTSF